MPVFVRLIFSLLDISRSLISTFNISIISFVALHLDQYVDTLEGMACYAGQFLAPAEGFGRGLFCSSCKINASYAVLANFSRFLVFIRNLSNV